MALPATDSFTAADATALTTYSASWTQETGTIHIYSNRATGSFDSWNYAVASWNADTFANDQYSTCTFNYTAADTSVSGGVYTRIQTGSANGYLFFVPSNTATSLLLRKVVSGTATTLSSASHAVTTADTIKLESNGTTHTCYINGSTTGAPTATVDSAHSSGRAGIFFQQNSSSAVSLDDWEGGDISSGTTVVLSSDSLAITESTFNVNAETSFSLVSDALVITEGTFSIGLGQSVTLSPASLVITESTFNVNLDKNVTLLSQALAITEGTFSVSLVSGANVVLNPDSLVITEGSFNVNAETAFSLTPDALTITEGTFSIALAQGVTIDGSPNYVINTNNGKVTLYFNGEGYFTI